MLACTSGGQGSTNASSSRTNPNPTPAVPASQTQAADLRTELDLLLGEQVMIVSKEATAAANHSDEFSGYAALLSVNSADLANLARSAFGDSAATQFSRAWDTQNAGLVEYTVGVVAHDGGKASAAMSSLTSTSAPQIAQLLTSLTQVPLDPLTQLLTQQILLDKVAIDDAAAQKYASLYLDVHTAYAQSSRLGDALAPRIAQKFPDKFPGDASARPVDDRVRLNLLLQEHAYVATMMGDAAANGRSADQAAAVAALASNADAFGTEFAALRGNAAATQLDDIWLARDSAIAAYAASADASARTALSTTFVTSFTALTHVDRQPVDDEVTALLKVLDEQRSKSYTSLAQDDRSAATAMQPIANALVQG